MQVQKKSDFQRHATGLFLGLTTILYARCNPTGLRITTGVLRLSQDHGFWGRIWSRPLPPLYLGGGFWDPSRGRGIDLTPMSLIQLFVYFLGCDIFKT